MPYSDPDAARIAARAAQQRFRERHKSEPTFLYKRHLANARARGIPFLLTFDEWWGLWEQSGKWELRGSRRGQYCMARPGDQGGYEIGNVEIILNEQNRAERNRNYPMPGESNPAFGKNYYAELSEDDYEARVAKISRSTKGKPKSQQMRERLSQSVTGRRRKMLPDGTWTWTF